ncbi:putative disease resistance RPP13-like protein 1, partial [Mucuna pruriens]
MAAELVGGALLSASLQVAFDRLASLKVLDFFRGRKLNEALLKKLNIMLLSINAVVDDAEEKQISDQYVKAWLDEVKDAVFEAEDLLDEIDIEVTKSKLDAESDQTRTCKVWNFFNASVSSFDKEIESRMRQVLEILEYLESKKHILGLKEASGSGVGLGRHVSQKLPTSSLVDETVIYGRDDEKEIIFNWLMCDPENDKPLSIISIVGMGGMGKTTLAQHIYNDPRMEDEFDIKVWVCVSDEFDVVKITRAILEAITGSINDARDINMLHVELKKKLARNRFLLVLDDVWNENHMQWEALQTPLNYGARGSKILVTTRSEKVASTMRANNIHHIEQLQNDHCWQLFARHAFQGENPQIIHEFKEIGRKIVEKCKGLPLALKTIGSLLYTKSSVLEWESILKSEIWDLPEENNNIIPALRLSYHHLPSHLKRCFAYCSLFPKDYVFDKEHLYLLWMAENFLQCPQQNKSMKEVGEQYFNDLLSRSFFQQSRGHKRGFIMHDLLNDLAKYVSGCFCFRLEDKEAQNISKMTRHFSFVKARLESANRFEVLHDAKRFRTFLPLNRNPKDVKCWMSSKLMHELFSKFKYLRVFSLAGYFNVDELPDSIGKLKHLRYIDVSHTSIKKLPNSVCLLYNLQVLKLKQCQFLEELPTSLHKLTNLHYLDFRGSKVTKTPMDFGKMKNLQMLSSFYVGKGRESNIQQLGELNLYRGLSISGLQNIENPLDASAANFKTKVLLRKLKLEWSMNHGESEKEREVLEKLQPSNCLINLSIANYGGTRFPDWFGENSLSKLTYLKLSDCKNCVLLSPLGLLSSLKQLIIKGLDGIVVIGDEFYGSSSSSFVSLETLDFMDMREWEKWDKIVKSAFPHLKRLSIVNCPKLKEHLPLPEQLPCLMEIEISNCQQLVVSSPCAPSALRSLTIGGCGMEGSFLECIGQTTSNTFIDTLKIIDCPNMNIPMHHWHNFLVKLSIKSSCDSLRTFSLDFFPKLRLLKLWKCSNLEMISQEHDHNLTSLKIRECPRFVSFPSGGLSAPRLDYFAIEKLENLKSLPESMHILLPSLIKLRILDCPQLESFSEGGLPSNLKSLDLSNCSKLIPYLKWAWGTNNSLAKLSVEQVEVESFPDQGLLPLSLTALSIIKCPNLKKLDYKGLCHLSSLQSLHLSDCPRLPCLPEEGLPKSISTLKITGNCSSSLVSGSSDQTKSFAVEAVQETLLATHLMLTCKAIT